MAIKNLPMREALHAALHEEMVRDERVFVMGEEVGAWQGTHRITHGFLEEFGERRVRDTPISEMVIAGAAVGAAMAAQRLGEDSVTVAFLGDGATSEGDVHEALNLAAVFGAPCVFFVQNNQWAISVPVERQQAGPTLAHRAIGYGMPGVRVDGNDVLACYAVMEHAAARARGELGPAGVVQPEPT